MRNFKKPTMVLLMALIFVFNLTAQTSTNQKTTEIVHEYVDGKLNHLKAIHGNMEVIFRNDRLEIFEFSESENMEKRSFLFFDNANVVEPKAYDIVSQGQKDISNTGIGKVLGVSTISVDKYQKVIYENLYPDANLVIRVSEKAISFLLENKSTKNNIPFGLSSWGDSDLLDVNEVVKFANHENLQLGSNDNVINVKGKSLGFAKNKSKSTNVSFTLNFLN